MREILGLGKSVKQGVDGTQALTDKQLLQWGIDLRSYDIESIRLDVNSGTPGVPGVGGAEAWFCSGSAIDFFFFLSFYRFLHFFFIFFLFLKGVEFGDERPKVEPGDVDLLHDLKAFIKVLLKLSPSSHD